jgi:hypothetical protein
MSQDNLPSLIDTVALLTGKTGKRSAECAKNIINKYFDDDTKITYSTEKIGKDGSVDESGSFGEIGTGGSEGSSGSFGRRRRASQIAPAPAAREAGIGGKRSPKYSQNCQSERRDRTYRSFALY